MMRVIERETGIEFKAEAIEGGFKLYTLEGEPYKKLKESTFKRYFKKAKNADVHAQDQQGGEKAAEEANTQEKQQKSVDAENTQISDEKREAMIEKVKKLLSLAENNPSQEEAISAALMAHKLMAKYNIHEDDVTLEEIKEDIESVFTDQKRNSSLHSWRKQLGLVVGKAFRCKTYLSGKDIVFRGYKGDAKLAHDTYLMLYAVGDRLGSREYTKQIQATGSGKGVYNSFVAGFIKGVEEALNQQCTALLVITPKEVEEEWKVFAASFDKKSTTRLKVVDVAAYRTGYSEGKSAVNSRSIEKKGAK